MINSSENAPQAGYVKLYRSALDQPVFKSDGLWRVWCWCLLKFSYRSRSVTLKTGRGFSEISLEPGQFIYGRQASADELNMPAGTARQRIQKLQRLGLISIESRQHCSIVSVVEWETYQDGPPATTRQDTRQTSYEHQATSHKQKAEVGFRSSDDSDPVVREAVGPMTSAVDQNDPVDRVDPVDQGSRFDERQPDNRTQPRTDDQADQDEPGDHVDQVDQSGCHRPDGLSKAEQALLDDAWSVALDLRKYLPMRIASDRDKNLIAKVAVLVVKQVIRRSDAIDCANGVKIMAERKQIRRPFGYFYQSLKGHDRIERLNTKLARTEISDEFVRQVLLDDTIRDANDDIRARRVRGLTR